MSKYLFIGAHLDDIELSCGGMVAKLIQDGHFVHVVSMTEEYDGVNLYEEFDASMKTLGVEYYQSYNHQTRSLSDIRNTLSELILYWSGEMDYVITHSSSCRHPDHKSVAEETKRVCNGNLMSFLQPWNADENPNYFVEISEQQLEKKIKALGCYRSQKQRRYFNPGFTVAQASYNGVKCGREYAEAFRIEKLIN